MKASYSVLLLSVLLGLSISLGCAQRVVTPTPPTTGAAPSAPLEPLAEDELTSRLREQNREYWEKISTLLEKTLVGVSEIRELSAPGKVGLRVVTAEWAKVNWGDKSIKENSKKIEIEERILKGLFILPDDARLVDLYAEWPMSYILSKLEDKVYFIRENFGRLNGAEARRALAHEVVHLLQDKHFETPGLATYDEEKAWSALIEGDADFSRTLYLKKIVPVEPTPEIGKLPDSSLGSTPGQERPPALTRLLYFPYHYGESFVSALYQRGGWQAVNEAYRKPPVTAEQIMHPEKYLSHEGPEKVLPLDMPRWRKERIDRFGEYFIKVMLETGVPEPEAGRAAQGWGGDRLTYYESGNAYLFTWQTRWDSADDAAEFDQTFRRLLQEVGAAPQGPNLWMRKDDYVNVRQRDSQEVVIIVSKDSQMVNAVLSVLNQR